RSSRVSCAASLLLLSFFQSRRDHRDLHSFPTRRSSDLPQRGAAGAGAQVDERATRRLALPHRAVRDRQLIGAELAVAHDAMGEGDRKSTRLNSSHVKISYAVFCLKKKKKKRRPVAGRDD